MKNGNDGKPDYGLLSTTSLGISMAVGISIFTYLGYRVGRKFGNEDLGALIGIFMGLFYCGYEVWKLIQRLNRDNPKK